MIQIEPIVMEVEVEQDGRILASVPEIPGTMAYGATEIEAIRRVKSIALQMWAEMIASGEPLAAGQPAAEAQEKLRGRCRGNWRPRKFPERIYLSR
jgi:predicted RNase H-like HicB family nuclease